MSAQQFAEAWGSAITFLDGLGHIGSDADLGIWPWYEMPANLMGYTGSPDYRTDGTGFEESGFNDAGVGLSATETIFSNEATLKVDLYNQDGGIVGEVIPTIILPQAKTAREGVLMHVGAQRRRAFP